MSGVFYCSPPYSFELFTELINCTDSNRLAASKHQGSALSTDTLHIYSGGSVNAPVHTYVCHRATHTHNLPEEGKEMTFTLVKRIRTDSIKLGHKDAKDSGDKVDKGGNGQQVFLEVSLYASMPL